MTYGRGVVLVLVAGSLWSLMGLGLRQIEAASVWQILFWRSVGMVPVLLAVIWWTSGGKPLTAIRSVGVAGALGGLSLVLAFAGAIYAIQTTTIANAVFLFSASPFVAAVLGWILLGERVRPWTWAAIALAAFGMYIMVREGLETGALAGNIAALLSAVGFGAFSVALRWGKVGDTLPVALLGGVFSILAAGLVLAVRGEALAPSGWDIGVSALIGAVILALGMVVYTAASRAVPAAELTLLSLIEVMLGPLWVWLFLGETASAATFVGGGVLLAAVVLNAVMGARSQRPGGLEVRARPVNE
jgi:drug/metabolite transporter (DMT)-like permease